MMTEEDKQYLIDWLNSTPDDDNSLFAFAYEIGSKIEKSDFGTTCFAVGYYLGRVQPKIGKKNE